MEADFNPSVIPIDVFAVSIIFLIFGFPMPFYDLFYFLINFFRIKSGNKYWKSIFLDYP